MAYKKVTVDCPRCKQTRTVLPGRAKLKSGTTYPCKSCSRRIRSERIRQKHLGTALKGSILGPDGRWKVILVCPECGAERESQYATKLTGICHSCAGKKMAKRESWRAAIGRRNEIRWTKQTREVQSEISKSKWTPERRVRAAESGKEQAKRRGGVPNAVKFTRERVAGKNNVNWKGGITPEVMRIRHSPEYVAWIKAVMGRDDYTCQICKVRGGVTLHAHHIQGFSAHPELRFDLENGVALCRCCHKEIAHGGTFTNPPISREDLAFLTSADSPVAIDWAT